MSPKSIFAVVGAPSEGKTTLIATLAEDAAAEIAPQPHTTRRCKPYDVRLDDEPVIRFIDTPGFEYPSKMMTRLEELKRSGHTERGSVEAFYNEAIENGHYRYEVELLTPLLKEDAAVIVVVDASRGYDATLEPVMQVLSWTCQPRAVVVNYHAGDEDLAEEMCRSAQRWAGIARKLNAAQATWTERFNLLEDLMLLCSRDRRDRPEIERTLKALRDQWNSRIEQAIDLIAGLIRDCAKLTTTKSVSADVDLAQEKQRRVDDFKEKVRKLERNAHQAIKKLYKYGNGRFDNESPLELSDLFSKETSRVFGLTRWQLASAGAAAGLTGGATWDVFTGGALLGVPSVALTAMGAVTGWFVHNRIPTRVRWLHLPGPLSRLPVVGRLGTTAVRKVEIVVGPVQQADFPVILLRRAMLVFQSAVHTPHGSRDHGIPRASCRSEPGPRDRTQEEAELRRLCATLHQPAKNATRSSLEGLRGLIGALCRKEADC